MYGLQIGLLDTCAVMAQWISVWLSAREVPSSVPTTDKNFYLNKMNVMYVQFKNKLNIGMRLRVREVRGSILRRTKTNP
jgi:hypothetical protein